MVSEDLILDPQIRNWVLLPIIVVMVLVGIGRSLAQQLMRSNKDTDIKILKHRQLLMRSQRLRRYGSLLRPSSYEMRKNYFLEKKVGKLRAKVKGKSTNPMENQSGMMDMMKSNMTMMVPNMVMMGWISYFFSGFVIVKVPFGLTAGFRDMLQRGVNLSTLDVSYVSSLSWYFLVMFGARGLFSLILGQKNVLDDAKLLQQQMGQGNKQADMQFDASKQYKAEKSALKHFQPLNGMIKRAEFMLLGLSPPKLV